MKRITACLLLMVAVIAASGCSTVGYYAQLADGHLSLLAARQPVDELLDDDSVPAALKAKLRTSQTIRDYASETLLLPDNGSYRQYADLKRDVVTWNVVATPKFSLQPERWCFLIAGCISYRGYYRREAANMFADSLRDKGLDVAVVGSAAYSTLGWFDDPLLNTMMTGYDFNLAGLLFHELAHQKVYVDDSSEFNEAFATVVERQGVHQWLKIAGDPDQATLYQQQKNRQREFLGLLRETRERLKTLYEDEGSKLILAREKQMLFRSLRVNYVALKERWLGYSGYDHWFDLPLNNAHLASVSTYHRWVPAFETLYSRAGNWQSFYEEVQRIAQLPKDVRQRELAQWLE